MDHYPLRASPAHYEMYLLLQVDISLMYKPSYQALLPSDISTILPTAKRYVSATPPAINRYINDAWPGSSMRLPLLWADISLTYKPCYRVMGAAARHPVIYQRYITIPPTAKTICIHHTSRHQSIHQWCMTRKQYVPSNVVSWYIINVRRISPAIRCCCPLMRTRVLSTTKHLKTTKVQGHTFSSPRM